MALGRLLEFCRDIIYRIVEYFVGGKDAIEILNALSMEGQSWSHYGQLIKDTKFLLQGFCSWDLWHVWRGANMAAHRLA
jgi:hypothetical protein